MYNADSSHSTEKRLSRYGYGPEYADPNVPVYRSMSQQSPRSSRHHTKRSQSVGRYVSSHKSRPRSGTTSDCYSGGPLESYYYPESPKSEGRSSTLRDLLKSLSGDDHGSRERGRHRSNSNSEHDFSATLLGGAVGGLAGRKFGHTVSGAVVGALAGNLVEHELSKKKEQNKHQHHHHDSHHSPHHHHHHHHSHHHHQSPKSSRYLSPKDASAKYGYAWGYDDEDYARSKSNLKHRSSSNSSRRSTHSYERHSSAIRY